jgi:hypothetical protein
MVPFQLPEEAFILDAVFLQNLPAHPVAKGGEEIALKILADARFVPKATGDPKSYSLHKLCSACGIV